MNSDNFGFEELDLWKKARSFKIRVTPDSQQFPN